MKPEATSRGDILAAARALAAESGPGGVSMRAVARRCGVAVGSLYHYFPSKGALIAAAVEQTWREIFHGAGGFSGEEGFPGCIAWLYARLRQGARDNPDFFTTHPAAFSAQEREQGRRVMEQALSHVRQGLLAALADDAAVDDSRFHGALTREALVDFVFTHLIALLARGEQSCTLLIEVVRRLLY